MWKILQKGWNDLLGLFFPNVCHLCGTPLVKGEEQLCLFCLSRLHYDVVTEPKELALNFIGRSEICEVGSYFRFEKEGRVQKLIHELKYYDNKELAYLLGRKAFLNYERKGSSLCNADVLLPVPLHKSRLRQRGYNQSEWIAKGISSVLGIPIDTTSVIRRKKTETQTKRSIYERWDNVQNIFELKDGSKLQGKRVLLVDDVLTTGSTLNSLAGVLQSIPDIYLMAFTLARV